MHAALFPNVADREVKDVLQNPSARHFYGLMHFKRKPWRRGGLLYVDT